MKKRDGVTEITFHMEIDFNLILTYVHNQKILSLFFHCIMRMLHENQCSVVEIYRITRNYSLNNKLFNPFFCGAGRGGVRCFTNLCPSVRFCFTVSFFFFTSPNSFPFNVSKVESIGLNICLYPKTGLQFHLLGFDVSFRRLLFLGFAVIFSCSVILE